MHGPESPFRISGHTVVANGLRWDTTLFRSPWDAIDQAVVDALLGIGEPGMNRATPGFQGLVQILDMRSVRQRRTAVPDPRVRDKRSARRIDRLFARRQYPYALTQDSGVASTEQR
jgi:hypothetical protein